MHNAGMITVVIPARNEAASLRELLPRLATLMREAEIIVVDDGSADDTAAVCAESQVKHLRHHYSMGNGAAIKTGARAARGEVIVFLDARRPASTGRHPGHAWQV
ncbi:glycosyltransferase family 2 protein [Propionivibrio sp.]|uniref:glycosyltransferase family 2 protein n=1 Tax=Propionivibrio sp. TaxID=2212460 RepID=UPI0025E6A1A1|nr:glycosyltransferase family 2 protein [Propionivibrio sp.]